MLAKLMMSNGGDGKSSEIPRPENLRLMSSRGDSQAASGLNGGRGGREGALCVGKKSSKVSPSAPVRTTRRESRLRSATLSRLPSVVLPPIVRVRRYGEAELTDEAEDNEGRLSSSSERSGRMSRGFPLAAGMSGLLLDRERRFKVGKSRLLVNTVRNWGQKCTND